MWKNKVTREDVARRSDHNVAHVLELFAHENPNPTLGFYLDLLEAAGARMDTASGNSVEHVVSRLGELRKRAGLNISEMARRAGMRRPHLSGIINGSRANMQLAVFDVLVTVLGAEEEMRLVDRWHMSQLVQLALAVGDETAAADDSSGPRLRIVPDLGSAHGATGDAPRVTASHSTGAASTAETPSEAPEDAERRAAEERDRAEQAKARAAAEQAEARAARERARAAERAARAEQERAERAEYERMRAEEKAAAQRAAAQRAAQEQARAEAAAQAEAQAREEAARAELINKVIVGTGIGLVLIGGVCIAKGVAGLRSNAA